MFWKKKSCLNSVLQSYVLEIWTINAKSRVINGICVDDGLLEMVPTTLVMKYRLMRQFYKVSKVGSLSIQRFEHASRGIENIHLELLLMNIDDDGNTKGDTVQSQLLSNFSL